MDEPIKSDTDLANLMDAHDDAYTHRQNLAYQFKQRNGVTKDELNKAMEAEEKARVALEQLKQKLSGLWPEEGK